MTRARVGAPSTPSAAKAKARAVPPPARVNEDRWALVATSVRAHRGHESPAHHMRAGRGVPQGGTAACLPASHPCKRRGRAGARRALKRRRPRGTTRAAKEPRSAQGVTRGPPYESTGARRGAWRPACWSGSWARRMTGPIRRAGREAASATCVGDGVATILLTARSKLQSRRVSACVVGGRRFVPQNDHSSHPATTHSPDRPYIPIPRPETAPGYSAPRPMATTSRSLDAILDALRSAPARVTPAALSLNAAVTPLDDAPLASTKLAVHERLVLRAVFPRPCRSAGQPARPGTSAGTVPYPSFRTTAAMASSTPRRRASTASSNAFSPCIEIEKARVRRRPSPSIQNASYRGVAGLP
jgi:hypothetical protein